MNARTLTTLPLVLILCASLDARAAEETPPPDAKKPPVEEPKRGQDRQAAVLAQEFGVEETAVVALRDKGMGWGEIRHALVISSKSGKPLSEIVALRESGMGWGQIAKEHGFTLGEAARRGGSGKGVSPAKEKGPRGRGNAPPRGRGHGGGPKR